MCGRLISFVTFIYFQNWTIEHSNKKREKMDVYFIDFLNVTAKYIYII